MKNQCAKNCNPMQTAMCTLMYFVQYKFIVKTVGPLKWPRLPTKVCFYFLWIFSNTELQSSRIWNTYFFLKHFLYFLQPTKQYNSMNIFITVADLKCLLRSSEVKDGHRKFLKRTIFSEFSNSNIFLECSLLSTRDKKLSLKRG